jgi:DNA-binding NtrC family response regulator
MAETATHILVADDDEGIRFVLEELLLKLGYRVTCADQGEKALELISREHFDLVILDLKMPRVDGLSVLRRVRQDHPDLLVLVITAYGSPELAMEAIREGAYDYFTKPFEVQDLRITIQRALEKKHLIAQIRDLQSRISGLPVFHEIIGVSDPMQKVFAMMRRVIDNDVPILVAGESGTGKEIVAEAIHARGPRQNGPMTKVNCAAIPEPLLESELFGHERGSFTGAIQTHTGKFEQAHGGTLFLDEIGDMPLALQAKILRAVQEHEVQRVGGKSPIPVNVRLITATNKNLAEEVAAKRFREDLYFRINVITIELPPLRERLADIPLLADYFIRQHGPRLGKMVEGISQEVLDLFLEYPWPGNIREMENVIQRALIMTTASRIQVADLPPHFLTAERHPPLSAQSVENVDLTIPMPDQVDRVVEATERLWISKALRQSQNRREAAHRLGISPRSLDYKIQRYGLS